jgi:uncharacterized protein DUF998
VGDFRRPTCGQYRNTDNRGRLFTPASFRGAARQLLRRLRMALATCLATAAERHRSLPADGMVRDPIFTSTHAITISAPPERVWPWIAQMGAGRGGWYSWDAVDNGGIPSSKRVLSKFQTMVPGNLMRAVPGATDAFVIAAIDPPRDLVLTAPDGRGGHAVAWEHVLEPVDGGRTRLIARARASSRWLDLAAAPPAPGHHRLFIERAYAVLARLPRPLLIAFAGIGHHVMEARHLRGIRRRSTVGTDTVAPAQWRRPLLTCGILAAVFYVAMTLFVGMLWDGYSTANRTISELSAIGAPTRPLWMVLGTVYTALMVAFGWVVWKTAPPNRAQRVVGMLLMIHGAFGLFWPAMHQRDVLAAGGPTLTDTLHIVWTIATGLLFLFETSFGAALFGNRFRVYSIATIAIALTCGAVTGTYTSALQADLPTPWLGVWERVSSTVYMLWIAVLATALLRAPKLTASTNDGDASGARS